MPNTLSTNLVLQNRYQVFRLLGEGGFGAVYLAQDLRLSGRAVAVKENFDNSAQAQAQFKVEADVLATLNHPSLPRVTDYFIEPSGRQYLVMDYVEGNDLETIVQRQGCLNEVQALPWFEQVCEALTYLHTQPRPVIHRDVKPGNIRIRSDGRAMLVDFGIAKLYDAAQKTLLGARAVSPGYSPLEQYGKGTTDARSDIYALGATMYFVFTGRQPPDATDLAARLEQLAPPRSLNPNLSVRTEQVMLKAMGVFADTRYPSAASMQQALHAPMPPAPAPLTYPSATPSQLVCSTCGALNRAGAKHCKSCGKPFQTQVSFAPSQPVPAAAYFPPSPPPPPAPALPKASPKAPPPAPPPPAPKPHSSAASGTQTVSFWRYVVTVVVLGVVFGFVTQNARSMPTLGQVAVMSIAAPLAYLLLKRPGAAFFTFAIQTNLIGSFSSFTWVIVGIAMEIVFALGRYRRDGVGIAIIAAVLGWIPLLVFYGSYNYAGEILFGAGLGGLAACIIKRIIKR